MIPIHTTIMPPYRFPEYHGIIGYLLVRAIKRCTLVSVFSLFVSGVVAGKEYGLETICSDITHSKNGIAPLCKNDLEMVRALSPLRQQVVQGNNSLDEFHFYPSNFLVRPRWQEDSFDYMSSRSCETDQDAMTIVRVSDTENRGIKHQQVRISQLYDYIVNENHNNNHQKQIRALVDDASRLKVRRRRRQIDPLDVDIVAEEARKFHRCCLDSIPKEDITEGMTIPDSTMNTTSMRAWKESDAAKRCREMGQHALADISQQLDTMISTGQLDEKNQLLRRVVAVWGNPSILAHLLLVFGCKFIDAYDEFLACVIQVDGLELDVHVHQRSVDVDPLYRDQWTCETCTIHQHPRWYASYVVTGQTTYTMVRPTCPTPTDMASSLSTVEELEKESPITGTSLIDTPGTRFHMESTDVVWETTEVVPITQGQSVVFSPLWYHRVIPPLDDATHAAVTLVSKFLPERAIGRKKRANPNYLLIPHDILPAYSENLVCFRLLDLYHALVNPELDVHRGLELFPCTDRTIHSTEDVDDFNMQVENIQNEKAVTDVIDEDEEL